MKIAYDLSVNHFTHAGVSVYTNELIAALQTAYPQDDFIGFSFHPWFSRLNYPWRKVDTWRYHNLWQKRRLNRALIDKGVDIYHETHAIAACRFSVPLVYTVNDLHPLKHPQHYPARWVAWVSRHLNQTLLQARAIITISNWVKEELLDAFPFLTDDKVTTIYDGVRRHFYSSKGDIDRVLSIYRLEQPYFLAVSTTAPNKNLERILQAFSQVADEVPHKLVLAGALGWGEQRWRALISEIGLNGRVRYLGFVPDDDLPSLYRAAEAFLYPSLYEGFGLPIVEAMVCGTPVLTSNRTSMPEVAGSAAILVDPYIVEAIADGMKRLATDADLRNTLRAKGLLQSSRFTWSRCAQETYALYKKVFETIA